MGFPNDISGYSGERSVSQFLKEPFRRDPCSILP